MRHFIEKRFTRIAILCFASTFVVVCLRAWFIPITHDEASTYFFYVQPNDWRPYEAHAWTNNHVLNSMLASFTYELFGSHPFSLRLPNILSFGLFAWGILRICSRHLTSLAGKFTLVALSVLTLNFLSFFSLCRGYGLSMAGLFLGISFLHDYFRDRKFSALIIFSLCLQVALAANLTLILCVAVLLPLIWMNQFINKDLLKLPNLLLQVFNIWLLVKWIRVALWYKSLGVLVSGAGHDYWSTTFKSLMVLVFGTDEIWIQAVLVLLVSLSLIVGCRYFWKNRNASAFYNPRVFHLAVLFLLIAAFFLQRWLLQVNYPDDRTALALYIFALFAISFSIGSLARPVGEPFAGIILLYTLASFVFSVNLRTFNHFFYHVMPDAFFDRLLAEQSRSGNVVTIGGHENRQMNYEFVNHRRGGVLNHMEVQDRMHMNCDFYYARRAEAPYYGAYYEEILADDWDRVLLKRKVPIRRVPLQDLAIGERIFSGRHMFFEFTRKQLPRSTAGRCIGVEADLAFDSVPVPFLAHFVLEVQNLKGETEQTSQFVMNHTADDLAGSRHTWRLTSEPLPAHPVRMLVYVWNYKSAAVRFRLDSLKVDLLDGEGVEQSVPPGFKKFMDWKTMQL